MKNLKYTMLLGILFSLLSFVSCSAEELKEEPKEHTYTFQFKPTASTSFPFIPECWPKKNIQATLIKPENSTWPAFLTGIFNMSQEWNNLIVHWHKGREKEIKKEREERKKQKALSFNAPSIKDPHCLEAKTGATSMNDIYIDFHIKSRQSLPKPIRINYRNKGIVDIKNEEIAYFNSHREVWPSDHLIRSRSELEALGKITSKETGNHIKKLYKTNFSKKKVLLLFTGCYTQGCFVA